MTKEKVATYDPDRKILAFWRTPNCLSLMYNIRDIEKVSEIIDNTGIKQEIEIGNLYERETRTVGFVE